MGQASLSLFMPAFSTVFIFIFKKTLLFVCMSVRVCVIVRTCKQVSGNARGRRQIPLELECKLPEVFSENQTQVLWKIRSWQLGQLSSHSFSFVETGSCCVAWAASMCSNLSTAPPKCWGDKWVLPQRSPLVFSPINYHCIHVVVRMLHLALHFPYCVFFSFFELM